MSGFDFDFKSSKTTHTFLRKGQGKRMSNRFQGMDRDFLRKGEGKLASSGHGEKNVKEILLMSNLHVKKSIIIKKMTIKITKSN